MANCIVELKFCISSQLDGQTGYFVCATSQSASYFGGQFVVPQSRKCNQAALVEGFKLMLQTATRFVELDFCRARHGKEEARASMKPISFPGTHRPTISKHNVHSKHAVRNFIIQNISQIRAKLCEQV